MTEPGSAWRREMPGANTALFDPDGRLIWTDAPRDSGPSVPGTGCKSQDLMVNALLGRLGRPAVRSLSVTRTAEELQLLTREAAVNGFFTLLPRGVFLERAVESFNVSHQERLGAVQIAFPAVYDGARSEMADLTRGYEASGRVFHLGGEDADLRLSYAADPGLLAWIKGRVLKHDALPYAITSPTQIFRRHKSGELGPLNRTHQFALPDLHILCHPDGAARAAEELMAANIDALEVWLPRSEVGLFFDVTTDFWDEHADLIRTLIRRVGTHCVVNRLTEQKRYYRMRGGLMVHGGSNALMLFNIQWDEENAQRFAIATSDGRAPIILHGNSLAGSGIMNMILGRGLADLSPRVIPCELDLVTTALIPLSANMTDVSFSHAARLQSRGLRVRVEPPATRGIGRAIRRVRRDWISSYSVIGSNEAESDSLNIFDVREGRAILEDELLMRWLSKLERCRGRINRVDRPVPFSVPGSS